MALKILNGIDVVGSMNITASDVPNLDAAKITSGTLSADRIPDLSAVYLTAGDYLDIDTANATFQPIGDYLISVPSEYLTIGDADGRYQPVGAYQPAGNYFTDGDSVINMNNNDGFVYDDTNNVMYVKLDGTQRALYHTGNFTDNSANWNTAYNWGNHASAGYLTSIPSDYIRQGTDIVSGNIQPIEDRRQLLGGEENRWKIVFCEILDSAGQHEKNLQNPAGETSVADYATGTVMVWENGKNVPCTTYANHMRMGIAVENVDSPMIQGAEPVLVTGAVAEGDYLVTSTTEGHAVAVSRDTVKQEQLWDCVIGKALESADGESHLIKTWVNI